MKNRKGPAVASLQYCPSSPSCFSCFVTLFPPLCYQCNGMFGMHLASHHVGCWQRAHWFVITIRVNLVFTKTELVYLVNKGFTPASWPFSSLIMVEVPAFVWPFCLRETFQAVAVFTFTNGVSWALLLRCTEFSTPFKWPHCVEYVTVIQNKV